MASDLFTLEHAEDLIGQLRGQVDRLNEIVPVSDRAAAPNAPANGFYLFSLLGAASLIDDSGLTGTIPSTQTDTSTNTVTQAATNQLGATFTVPAGNANLGTCYRYKAGGFGTWASSGPRQLTLVQLLGATNINQINIAAAAFAVSAPFDWDLEMTYIITATGSGGTCRALLHPTLNVNNAAVDPSAPPNFVTGVRQAGGITFNTTISRVLQLNALWASTTGAPTITCDRSTFERIGP